MVKPKDNSDSEDELNPETHKKSLEKLKKIDPDFYSFLEENDENLLNFGVDSDEESKGEDEENDDEDDVDFHKPQPLEGHSDESDFEDEDAKPVRGKVTLKMVSEWQKNLQTDGKVHLTTLTTVIKAFNAAMLRATTEEGTVDSVYKVEGSSVFNAVIQMCVLYLPAALKKYLGMERSGKDPQKCKHFVKIKTPLIAYLQDLLKLLSGVTSTNILTVLLKHLHQMSVYVACFSRTSRKSLKKLITLWSSGEETVRVLAFLCMLRITRNQQATLLDTVLKAMYLTYVKNSKFVSPTTWPGINFMRRSLVEMFSLDPAAAYPHVFLYVRQLAIHLRNAIVVQKPENRQAVYNWQFVNSLRLWAELLGAGAAPLQPLLYPLVMVITNTVRLVPTHQYYPLRFHCVEILITLSQETDTFIPVLPYLVEVLTSYDFNKKHSKASMKPLDLSCVLRLSRAQLAESGLRDAALERVYGLLLQHCAGCAHHAAFPDLAVLAIVQIKQFLKTCTVPNYTKKIRQLLEKIEENSRFIERERAAATLPLADLRLVAAWEAGVRARGTPLQTYYDSWNKLNKIQKRKKITNNEELADKLPSIKKRKMAEKEKVGDEPFALFPSDSEDEKEYFEKDDAAKKEKKAKNKKSRAKSKPPRAAAAAAEGPDRPDEVQEFSVADW